MSWFARWLRPTRPARPQSTRLRLEVIEDRLAPAVLSVVHPSLANGTSTFASIGAAQGVFNGGDIIQIEPGSSPGPMGVGNLAGQTIRGNPAFSADTLPVVAINQSAAVFQANVTLRNLNVVLGDSLTITGAGWTIEGCVVTNAFNIGAAESLIDLDSTGTTLRNNRFTGIVGISGGNIVGVTPPAAGSNNLITDNTFFAFSNLNLVEYEAVALRTVTDQVVNNTFLGQVGADTTNAHIVVADGANIAGLTITNNSFTDNSTNSQEAIYIRPQTASGTSVTISKNRISFPSSASSSSNAGVIVESASGLTRTLSLLHNDISTGGNGIGILVVANATTATELVGKVEGNDLHRNRIGVNVQGTGSGSFVSGVDLGGGGQGSLGLNNFRGFTAAATATAGAVVVVSGFTNAQTLFARNNIWSVGNPEDVIRDSGDAALNVNVDSASPLTANQSAVAALYHTFLRRSADVNNPAGAGLWVNQLTGGTPFSTVANGIGRSPEALGYVIDGLYKSILGRDADPVGRPHHINLLASGFTVEQIQIAFFASAEYRIRFGGDPAFVSSLFQTLLGRVPSSGDLDTWLNLLPSLGRSGVANGFVQSTEYRTREVTNLFFDVLKRTAANAPSAADVAFQVNTGLDLLSLRIAFVGSAEFFVNG